MTLSIFAKNKYGTNLRRTLLMLSTISGLLCTVSAQSNLSLIYPFGVPIQPNSGMSFTMGGAGSAVSSPENIMLLNPANLGNIDKTEFSSLLSLDATMLKQSGSSSSFYSLMPQQFSFAFPAGSLGTFGFSLDQRSNALTKFRIEPESIPNDSSELQYRGGIMASGGQKSWQAGWGREFKNLGGIKLGISYEHLYYYADRKILRSIIDSSGTIESTDSTNYLYSGDGVRAGVMMPFGKLTVGLSGEYFAAGTLKKYNALYSPGDTTKIDSSKSSVTLTMPPSITLGLAYGFSQQWLAAADLTATIWNAYDSHGVLPSSDRSAALSLSAGAQYSPETNILNPKYLQTMNYRAGFRYTELPTSGSNEYAVSFGCGLPIGGGRGLCDIGAELGRRTDTQYSGYSENYIRFTLGISGGSKWKKSTFGDY